MNFAELRFWELLALGLGAVLLLRALLRRVHPGGSAGYDKGALAALSLFLLGCVSWLTLGIFLAVTFGTYLGLAWILRQPAGHRRAALFVLIPLQLLPLFYYKYAHFVAADLLGWRADWFRQWVIPVGISFYTFQLVGFVLDTLHFQKPLPRFADCLNFISFFPQIVAGPIERRDHLLPQMESFRFRWLPREVDEGAAWVALGLFFKCCLADNFSLFFDRGPRNNAWLIWLNNVVFGLRIYFDFAGYSLVALGLGRCLGLRLTLNFASPYCATSATEFWHRWHITLSQWFRDYLYIPLGGSRVRWWAFNILLVFIVSGVWHGAGWNFILWGGLHGLFLLLNRLLGPRLPLPAPAGWALTLLGSFAAWLCFYETDITALGQKLQTLVSPAAYGAAAFQELLLRWQGADRLVLLVLLLLAVGVLGLEWRSLARSGTPYSLLTRRGVTLLLIVLTVLLAPGKNNDFIYFAF